MRFRADLSNGLEVCADSEDYAPGLGEAAKGLAFGAEVVVVDCFVFLLRHVRFHLRGDEDRKEGVEGGGGRIRTAVSHPTFSPSSGPMLSLHASLSSTWMK